MGAPAMASGTAADEISPSESAMARLRAGRISCSLDDEIGLQLDDACPGAGTIDGPRHRTRDRDHFVLLQGHLGPVDDEHQKRNARATAGNVGKDVGGMAVGA